MSANPTSARVSGTTGYTPANPGTNAADGSESTVVDLNYVTQGTTDTLMIDLGSAKNVQGIDLYNYYTVPATPYAYIDVFVSNDPANPTQVNAGRIINGASVPGAPSNNAVRLTFTQNGYRYVTLSPTFLANVPAGQGSPRACIVYVGEMLVETSGTPAAPTNVTATGNVGGIAVAWTASSSATSMPGLFYRVKRASGTGTGPTTQIADNVTGTSYSDTSAGAGQPFSYAVTAVNPNG